MAEPGQDVASRKEDVPIQMEPATTDCHCPDLSHSGIGQWVGGFVVAVYLRCGCKVD